MPRKCAQPIPIPPIGRHRDLLQNPEVKEWYEARRLRSRLSADTYLRQLGLFVERLGLDAEGLARTAREDPDRLRSLLTKLASDQKGAGLLDAYISKSFGGLKSWLEFRHARFDGYPKLSPVKGQSLVAERVPTPDELGSVLDRLSLRGRVTALLMAHAGLRPGVLGSYGGENGLRIQDIPELKPGRPPRFEATPFVIRVPASLSKTRVEYTTFGSTQLAAALRAYLSERREGGEKLRPSSPVVAPAEARGIALRSQRAAQYGRGFLTTKSVVEEIREALQATTPRGVTWRPYVLRSYCSTRLMLAEGSGRISRDLREAILGHDGGIAARYNVGKRWGDELLKEARAAYKRCEPFLSTTATPVNTERDLTTRMVVLRMHGYSAEELAKIDLASKTDDELIALADAKRLENQRASGAAPTGPGQKAVTIAEVGKMLEAGWEYVAPLGMDRAVLRLPQAIGSAVPTLAR
ncbi:MAG: hypothetical protein L3K05_05455 [Thermoplasmata archaeon]|nr:hypothetical protein [Thermoplasmata archaeon]